LQGLLEQSPALQHVRSLPGMGPILAAVVVTEIDGIEAAATLQQVASLGLRRGCLGCYQLLGLLRGLLQTQASAWQEAQHRNSGHRASDGSNHLAAVDAVPQLHERVAKTQYLRGRPAERMACAVGLAKEVQKPLKDPSDFPRGKTFPSRSTIILVGR